MRYAFKKMNGAGNDFVIFDNRNDDIDLDTEQIATICDRRRGVGGDGVILIEPSDTQDFFMKFYNSDGTLAEMCGNGARCSAAFAVSAGLGTTSGGVTSVRFMTGSGGIEARVCPIDPGRAGRCLVAMEMMDARDMRLDVSVRVAETTRSVHFVIVGTRHAVVEVDDARLLTDEEVMQLGRAIRQDAAFAPAGVNVNFASIDEGRRVHIRTYEKGVEAETHACGTGSVAAGVVFAHRGRCVSPVVAVQKGGDELAVSFELNPGGATRVALEGPVDVNFEGAIDL